MRKTLISLGLTLIMLVLTSCGTTSKDLSTDFVSGLEIPEMTTSLGSEGSDTSQQVFSYNITLINTNEYEVEIQWVEPVLSNELQKRVLTEDLKVSVEKAIAPGGLLRISGKFSLKTEGTTKEQILEWEPFLRGMHVASEASLPLPPVNIQ
jgi:hypothetical protein